VSIRRNTLVNLAGQVAPIAVTLLTVPPYLRLIGEERYGVLMICWTLLGYFGLFDLGLSQATAQRMASLRDATDEDRGNLLWTALLLSGGFGLLAGLVFWLAGRLLLTHFVPSGGALHTEALAALPWLAASLPITIFASSLAGALQGRERFVALNFSQALGNLLSQTLPLTVAWLGKYELVQLIPAVLVGRVTTTLLMLGQCRTHVPLSRSSHINWALVRPLINYGGWVSITSAAISLTVGLDRIMIGAVSGAKSITYYSVPQTIVNRIRILPAAFSRTLFPRFSQGNYKRNVQLRRLAICVMSIITTPIIVAGILILEPFLAIWISADFSEASHLVGEILLVGLWVSNFSYIDAAWLNAQHQPRTVATVELSMLIPYVVILYLLLQCCGASGAALAWTVRATVGAAMLTAAARVDAKTLSTLIIPGILILLALILAASLPWKCAERVGASIGLMLITLSWACYMASRYIGNLGGLPFIGLRKAL
jgi:O-antigen/teichoic acid export membrane protein